MEPDREDMHTVLLALFNDKNILIKEINFMMI